MNETVTIKEGGLTRRLAPIDKLKVNTTDNKDSMWVSTGDANTGVLHASENGIYIASEDGYEAYSEVIVRVTKDSFEGDTSFDDWDYETPDMDLENWDPETIEDFELDPDGFDDVFNNENEWKDIDKPIDIKMDNPKIDDMKVSGIDPISGNEMEVGLDEDGYLTESTLPSSIKIVQLPSKLKYKNGEKILFNLVVKAYTADGNLWTGESELGVIKTRNLTFPVTIAQGGGEEYSDGDGINAIKMNIVNADGRYRTLSPIYTISDTEGADYPNAYFGANGEATVLLTQYRNQLYAMLITGDSGVHTFRQYYLPDIGWYWSASSTTAHTKKDVFVELIAPDFQEGAEWFIPTSTKDPSGSHDMKPTGQTVPVQYIRSDGEVLEDSFTIEVLPDPDGAHPQVDPSTVEWNHRRYKANEELGAVEVRHGSVYMEGGAIYDVGAAVRLGMLEPVDNEIVP